MPREERAGTDRDLVVLILCRHPSNGGGDTFASRKGSHMLALTENVTEIVKQLSGRGADHLRPPHRGRARQGSPCPSAPQPQHPTARIKQFFFFFDTFNRSSLLLSPCPSLLSALAIGYQLLAISLLSSSTPCRLPLVRSAGSSLTTHDFRLPTHFRAVTIGWKKPLSSGSCQWIPAGKPAWRSAATRSGGRSAR